MIKLELDLTPIKPCLPLLQRDSGKNAARILAQLKFAQTLSLKSGGKFEELLRKCCNAVLKAEKEQGAVTAALVSEIETILTPLKDEAKSYEFICAAHAHIDMNWMWGYNETVAVTLDTFRTMLNLLKQYPQYHFSQSQASVYKIVEEFDPQMFREIQSFVKEGRWEVTASTWVETDKNIPLGESLARHILYTKKYFKEKFGIDGDKLSLDFEPDTFGHNKNVPEILCRGGVKYYYHCRGQIGEDILYRWQAPSGADIIVYTEPFWYNATIDREIGDYAVKLSEITKSKTLLKVYGVGDHGGGPTRRDVEMLIEMNDWPIYPKFTFGTIKGYFDAVEHLKPQLPLIDDEINFLCDGCYTTQAIIKEGNRKSERLLEEAEIYSAIARAAAGGDYPTENLEKAWIKTLFNHFHDIIPGSGVTATREHASGRHQEVFAAAESAKKNAMYAISQRINTNALMLGLEDDKFTIAEGAGAGSGAFGDNRGRERIYHIFNPRPYKRKSVCEITLWDYTGNFDYLEVYGSNRQKLEFQLIGKEEGYWGHMYRKLLVEAEIPAFGTETVLIADTREMKSGVSFFNDMRVQTPETFVLENGLVRFELNSADGTIKSVLDKENGEEISFGRSGILRLATEAVNKEITGWNGGMSAWFIGRYKHTTDVSDNMEIVWSESGSLRNKVTCKTCFGKNSSLTLNISLEKDSKSFKYDLDCAFRELGSERDGIPNLFFSLPLPYTCQNYTYDIPFGTTVREEANMDLPASSFVFAPSGSGGGFMLSAKNKHGFRCFENTLGLTLVRGSYDPDPTPEIRDHHIEFAVSLTDSFAKPQELITLADCTLRTPDVISGSGHSGDLPLSSCFIECEGAVVTAFKKADIGFGFILRLAEVNGKSSEVSVKFALDVKSACFSDITEEKAVDGKININGNQMSFTTNKNQISTIRVEF